MTITMGPVLYTAASGTMVVGVYRVDETDESPYYNMALLGYAVISTDGNLIGEVTSLDDAINIADREQRYTP